MIDFFNSRRGHFYDGNGYMHWKEAGYPVTMHIIGAKVIYRNKTICPITFIPSLLRIIHVNYFKQAYK